MFVESFNTLEFFSTILSSIGRRTGVSESGGRSDETHINPFRVRVPWWGQKVICRRTNFFLVKIVNNY